MAPMVRSQEPGVLAVRTELKCSKVGGSEVKVAPPAARTR